MKHFLPTCVLLLIAFSALAAPDSRGLRKDYYQTQLAESNLTNEERVGVIDSLIKYDPDHQFSLYLKKADLLSDLGKYRECLETYQTLRDALPEDSIQLKFQTRLKIAVMKFTLSNYRGALEDAYAILEDPKPDYMRYVNVQAHILLRDFYGVAENNHLAVKHIRQAQHELEAVPVSPRFTKAQKDRLKGVLYICSSGDMLRMDSIDAGYSDLKKGEGFIEWPEGKLMLYNQYAEVADRRGEPQIAEDYIHKALDIKTESFNKVAVLIQYMKFLLDRKRGSEIPALLDKYKDVVQKISGTPSEVGYLQELARFYASASDRDRRIETLERMLTVKDSLYNASVIWEAEGLASRFENDKNRQIITGLQSESKQRLLIICAVTLILLIVAAVSIYLWSRFKKSKLEVNNLADTITANESQHQDELRETAESLSARNRELASMTMYMARLTEALNSIKETAENGSVQDSKRLSEIKTTVRELDQQNNIWEIFRTYFESVNQSFFNNLYQRHPDLTKGEVRMCAFILVGLSNKEIAMMTNRSVRTVEVVKRNIRKKIGITEPTPSYLRKLASMSSGN